MSNKFCIERNGRYEIYHEKDDGDDDNDDDGKNGDQQQLQ